MAEFTHFDETGASRMVDVGAKQATRREARAIGRMRMARSTLDAIEERKLAKGDVLEVARIAGIAAAKRTSDLIPLCHNLPLDSVRIDFRTAGEDCLEIEATAAVTARTGVEMEALVAVTVAALTIYDMCKSVDRGMELTAVQLVEKSGGQSGHYVRP